MKVYKCLIPEGKSGPWSVVKFELTKEDLRMDFLQKLRDIRDTGEDRTAKPGQYTKLTRNGSIIMSDTPAELSDLRELETHALGGVLIHGLGLGIAVELALMSEKVTKVTVIEKDPDVIKLVGPTLKSRWGDRLHIVEADAFLWKPPKITFQYVWSDIWDSICSDNLEGMKKLKRMWSRRTLVHGFWCRMQCMMAARRYY